MNELAPAPIKPTVAITTLEALDIRVGTIERVEEIPRSAKLMKLSVNFGGYSRTVLAGIKRSDQIHAKSKDGRPCSS